MKKIVQIIVLLIAIIILFALAKYTLFRDGNSKMYDEGWTAYENKQYDLAIFQLSHVDKNKYPDIVAPLGFSYFEKKDYQNALENLQYAYDKKIGLKEGYLDKITNTLGIIYMERKDFKKSRFYLKEAMKHGSSNSIRNIQIIDSIEQEYKIKETF